jgi:hypothetical protein
MAFCNSCGTPSRPEDKFCANCGQQALPPATNTEGITATSATASVAVQAPPNPTAPKKSGIGATTLVLSIALALAVIFGGGATFQWLDNSSKVKNLTAETETLTTDKTSLQSQVASLNSQVQSLTGEKVRLETDKANLTAELATKISPLKNFTSEFELQNWITNAATELNPLDGYFTLYYKLQQLAMEDGFFLSIWVAEDEQYYYAEAYAVVGDLVYICYEDGSIYPWMVLPP